VASQDPLLARERDVIEVLVDGDLDGEVERGWPPGIARSGPSAVSTHAPHVHVYFCCFTETTR
jgi:hypothetical protein